ncbi:hypothetical protein NL676_001157 [Syzygium grande]|nr:hypothetical protein NL676_001157 [Syzygium grande]
MVIHPRTILSQSRSSVRISATLKAQQGFVGHRNSYRNVVPRDKGNEPPEFGGARRIEKPIENGRGDIRCVTRTPGIRSGRRPPGDDFDFDFALFSI